MRNRVFRFYWHCHDAIDSHTSVKLQWVSSSYPIVMYKKYFVTTFWPNGTSLLKLTSFYHIIYFSERRKVSLSEFLYKYAFVKEMRVQLTSRIKKTITEIKTSLKCAKKQPKESADCRKNVLTNPVYARSAGENSFDLKRNWTCWIWINEEHSWPDSTMAFAKSSRFKQSLEFSKCLIQYSTSIRQSHQNLVTNTDTGHSIVD